MTTPPPRRHCTQKECNFYGEGNQVPCRLYELDLLHGRKRLTYSEVQRGQIRPRTECTYELPLKVQIAQTKPKRKEVLREIMGMSKEKLEQLLEDGKNLPDINIEFDELTDSAIISPKIAQTPTKCTTPKYCRGPAPSGGSW